MFTIDSELGVYDKYHISPNELFALRAILSAQEEESEEFFIKYMSLPETARGCGLREILISLQEKGIIKKSYKIPDKGQVFDPLDVEFNSNVLKQIHRSSFEMGNELFEHYPQFATINGALVSLRGISQKWNTPEDAWNYYGKCIKWNNEIHKEIIDLIDWAKENNIINCALWKFIIDRRWIDLKALKEGDSGNINYNAVKMI